MRYEVTLGGVVRTVDVRAEGGGWRVRVGGGPELRISGGRLDPATWRLLVDGGRPRTVGVALDGDHVFVLDGVAPQRGSVVDPRARALVHGAGASEGRVVTQMPGAVVRVLVAEGDTVEAGQVLLVVEAMKMENEFKAPFAGTIANVAVVAGQAVEAGALLVELEAAA